MAFTVLARVLPRYNPAVVTIEDDYDFVHNSDASSDFGVQSLAETCATETTVSQTIPETYIRHSKPFQIVDSWLCQFVIPWDEPQGKTIGELDELEREFPHCSVDVTAANELALAGRGDAGHTFKDSRSAAKSRRRDRAEREKYWSFRVVKRGDRNALYHGDAEFPDMFPRSQTDAMTKRTLYETAQCSPRPPKHSHRDWNKDRWPWQQSFIDRRSAKKHAMLRIEELAEPVELDYCDLAWIRDTVAEDWERWTYACQYCHDAIDESDELARLRVVSAASCSCTKSNKPLDSGG